MCCLSLSQECCSGSRDSCCLSECCDPICQSHGCCPSDTKCQSDVRACCTVFRHVSTAVIVRILYILFASGVFAWKVISEYGPIVFDWVVLSFCVIILLEMLYTAIWRKGKEWKWFAPSTFALLLAILPTICDMQVELTLSSSPPSEATTDGCTCASTTPSVTPTDGSTNYIPPGKYNQDDIKGLALAMVFLIMFGKWMAPKGNLTAQEHSLLLIGILASGADITDILELLKGKPDFSFVLVVLVVFSWSLLHLCFSTTTVKTLPATDFKENTIKSLEDATSSRKPYSSIRCNLFCFYNEIWALVLTLLCLDVPFLAIRLFAIITGVNTEITTFYFAIKNVVTILVSLNRIRIIFKEEYRPWKEQCKELRNHERTDRRYIASDNIGFES